MSHPKVEHEKFYVDILKGLVGKKVTSVAKSREGTDLYLGINFDDGSTLWMLSDDEGNAPGSFEVQ